jgi:flagellar protein FlaG
MNTEVRNAIQGPGRLALPLSSGPRATPAQPAPMLRAVAAAADAGAAQTQAAAKAAVLEANRKLTEKGTELALEFDDALGRTIFKLVDTRTREVVRQIPSEAMLAVARALADETATGAILSTDA